MAAEAALSEDQFDFNEAFGADTMTFTEWLQFVFLPAIRDAIQTGGFPQHSQVGAHAVREFDGWTEAGPLLTLLSDFDAFIERRR